MRASQALEVGSIPIARSNKFSQALEQLLLLIVIAGYRFCLPAPI